MRLVRPKAIVLLAAAGALAALLVMSSGKTASAQWGRYRGEDRANITRDIFPTGTFTFCRVMYTSVGRGGYWRRGGRWATDFPDSDLNFSQRLSEITTIDVNRDEAGNIEHAVVELTDDALFNYPFIYMCEVGDLEFSPEERDRLKSYLLRGGFLMVDDFWGDYAWENWAYEFEQVMNGRDYPIVDIPLDHPIFHIVFDVKEVPQVPSVNHYEYWAQTGDSYEGQPTSDSRAHCRGVFDKKGRLMAIFMHNTDLGDGWEREGQHEGYFRDFSVKRAYPMGINIIVYAMTH